MIDKVVFQLDLIKSEIKKITGKESEIVFRSFKTPKDVLKHLAQRHKVEELHCYLIETKDGPLWISTDVEMTKEERKQLDYKTKLL